MRKQYPEGSRVVYPLNEKDLFIEDQLLGLCLLCSIGTWNRQVLAIRLPARLRRSWKGWKEQRKGERAKSVEEDTRSQQIYQKE